MLNDPNIKALGKQGDPPLFLAVIQYNLQLLKPWYPCKSRGFPFTAGKEIKTHCRMGLAIRGTVWPEQRCPRHRLRARESRMNTT